MEADPSAVADREVAALRRLPYFRAAAEATVSALAGALVRRRADAGEVLFLEGDRSAGLWLVERGRLKVCRVSLAGDEYVVRVFGPGDSLNEIAAIDGSPNPVTAVAITDVEAWTVPAEAFSAALASDPAVSEAVIRELAARLRRAIGQSEDLALRSVTARLARFLLERSTDPAMAHPAITRALLAGHLGTTSESISRSLRTLEEAGAIEFDRHRIVIVDPGMLADLAEV